MSGGSDILMSDCFNPGVLEILMNVKSQVSKVCSKEIQWQIKNGHFINIYMVNESSTFDF